MVYRNFDGIDASLLGFGCMRFPTNADGGIDEAEATRMLDKARAAGVNYFDTAYPYHGGESEPFVGRYLSKLPRDSYYVATKLPCWDVHSLDDAKKLFERQIERTASGYIDFYLLHALNRGRFEEMDGYGVYDYLTEMKKQGRIKHLGFSFHDDYDAFEFIAKSKKWDFCQIQLNYMDTDEQAGMKGYELTKELGIPLIIMEPIKGGSLATLPDEVTEGLRRLRPESSVASWALRWVGSLDNVKVILSGMSTMAQVEDNLGTFAEFEPLSAEEQTAVTELAASIRKRIYNGCTGCRYCMPCPAGVDIPHNFRIWNDFGMYRNKGDVHWNWTQNTDEGSKAKNCIECGQCEEACPQKLNIRENLKALQKQFDEIVSELTS